MNIAPNKSTFFDTNLQFVTSTGQSNTFFHELRGEKIYLMEKLILSLEYFCTICSMQTPLRSIEFRSYPSKQYQQWLFIPSLRSHISIEARASVLQDGQTMMGKKEARKSNKLVRSMWFSVVFPLIFWWHRFGIHWNGNIGRKSPILLVAFWERPPQTLRHRASISLVYRNIYDADHRNGKGHIHIHTLALAHATYY